MLSVARITADVNAACGKEAEKRREVPTSSSVFVLLAATVLVTLSACQPLSTRRTAPTQQSKASEHQSLPNDESAASPVNAPDTSVQRRKIPTLREQMERLQNQQELMNARLDTVQTEIRSIRQRVDEQAQRSAPPSTANNSGRDQTFTKGDAPVSATAQSNRRGTEGAGLTKKDSKSGLILPDNADSEGAMPATKGSTSGAKKSQGTKAESTLDDRLGDVIRADNESEDTPKPKVRRIPKPRPKVAPSSTNTESASAQKSAPKETPAKAVAQSTGIKASPKEPKSQLDGAMGENPVNKTEAPNPLFTTATGLFNKKQYQEAADLFGQVAQQEKNPEVQARAQYWMGESYYGLGKYDDAIKTFNKVIGSKSSEKSSKALSMIAESMIRMGQTAEAKKTYQKLQKLYPQSEEAVRAAKRLQQL